MRERIAATIAEIERSERVRVLLAVESGSRAWGFASPDSDYDVRFVYVREARDYLRVVPKRDVIERPITDVLDVNGWDMFKALSLFRKSNPPLLEWLFSPILYREAGTLAARLRELAQSGYSPRRLTYHYVSMAKGNYKDYIAGRAEVPMKKYLYALRPLLCIRWMEQRGSPAPTSLIETLDGIILAGESRESIQNLIQRKRQAGEMGLGTPDAALNAFIEAELARIEQTAAQLPDSIVDEETLNALAWAELGL